MKSPVDIPQVLYVRPASGPLAPLVFDSPHSGTHYPVSFKPHAPLDSLRKSEDTYVDELYAGAADFGIPVLGALFPRCFLDANRGLHELDPSLIDGKWPHPLEDSEKAKLGVGLIWRKCRPNRDIYDRKLTVDETEARLDTYWRPYHETLQSLLNAAYDQFGAVWHINCHSMPEMSDELSKEGPGHRRSEFCLGDRGGTTCAPEFLHLAKSALEDMGYQVAVNEPYAGVELVRAYSDPASGRHSLQVEIRRDLYMNEDTFEKTAEFEELQSNLTKFSRILAEQTRAWAA